MSAITDLNQETFNDLKSEELSFFVTLSKKTFGTYSISTGKREITEVSHNAYLVFKKGNASSALPKYYELREGDKICICAANGIEILKDDKITIESDIYNVNLSMDSSVGTNSLFTLVINK